MNTEFIEITWTKDLETGIDVLDAQHHRHFDLLGKYIAKAAMVAKTSSDTEKVWDLAETLNFLNEYAKEHFATEEAVMQEAEYAEYEQHKEEHEDFLKHVGDLYNEMKTTGYSVITLFLSAVGIYYFESQAQPETFGSICQSL